jgi:putative tryptophan/tyrosine transport system substrate-binding protein
VKRREFNALIGGAVLWPLGATAQQTERLPKIGMLMGTLETDPEGQQWAKRFLQTLEGLGWQSKTQISVRWGAGDSDRMRAFAKELVDWQPDVINVTTTPATAAVLRATSTVPVVFSIVSDPVGAGFVKSLPRPEGNATGFINVESSLGGKWIELLKEVMPGLSQVAVMFSPDRGTQQMEYYRGALEAAAQAISVKPFLAPVRDSEEIAKAFANFPRTQGIGLIVVPGSNFSLADRVLIVSLAERHRVPGVYPFRFWARSGGLLSYGVDLTDLQRQAAVYVDRILKGAKPADLPVQLPTKFELAANAKVAGSMGLTIPPTLLARADEVIE